MAVSYLLILIVRGGGSANRFQVYIDENGDAAGNYSILAVRSALVNGTATYGLHPIGTFSPPNGHQIPVTQTHTHALDPNLFFSL